MTSEGDHLEHGPPVPQAVGGVDSQPPPGLHPVGVQLQEQQEAVQVIEALAHRGPRHTPLVHRRQSVCKKCRVRIKIGLEINLVNPCVSNLFFVRMSSL